MTGPAQASGAVIGTTSTASGGWRDRAVCLGEDPELFFPIGATGPALLQIAVAKAVCHRCPVIDDCLRWALETGEDAGVWGGLSEEERRSIRRRAARADRAANPRPPATPAPAKAAAPAKAPRPTGCGTMPGYRRHRELHERICDPCKAAKRAASARERRRARGHTEQAA